jgi:hypothetical protein
MVFLDQGLMWLVYRSHRCRAILFLTTFQHNTSGAVATAELSLKPRARFRFGLRIAC